MKIIDLDHFVLTVRNLDKTVDFYHTALGMEKRVNADGRISLHFADKKINLHEYGREFLPKAAQACPGTSDLCFLVNDSVDQVILELEQKGLAIELGPIERTGAIGKMMSVYLRDPDGNLIEIAKCES